MKSSFLIAILLFLSLGVRAEDSSKCAMCDEVETMTKAYSEDEAKGYEKFHYYVRRVENKLSADKKTAAVEISSLLKATLLMQKTDAMGDLPYYVVAIEDARPSEFAEALKTLSKDQQKTLKKDMKRAREFLAEGEEGPNTSKEPAQK